MAFAMRLLLVAAFATLSAVGIRAGETVTYAYDAKGRLVRVVKTGSVNNGVSATYDHDKADNRRRVLVTGAPR